MTANTTQPTRAGRERRIIERPRLMKMLDETDARVILLIAPAGYGKTTLARQWARSLQGAITISLTPAHRDVATLAEDIAHQVSATSEDGGRFITQFVRARTNPQRAAREIGHALANTIDAIGTRWLIVDDYQEVGENDEGDALFEAVAERTKARLLVLTRQRPRWATSRRSMYDELFEIRREHLAMTAGEAKQVVGNRKDLDKLVAQAQGWAAVLSLATKLPSTNSLRDAIPGALHDYVADELFASADSLLRNALLEMALLPDQSRQSLERQFGASADETVAAARELGFLVNNGGTAEIHPLLREFLFAKIAEQADGPVRIRAAVDDAINSGSWEHALELVMRFNVRDRVEAALTSSYKPLLRSGRVGTLSRFADNVRVATMYAPPVIDVVEAEIALRDGHLRLAADLGGRILDGLGKHPLASRTGTVVGQSQFLLANFSRAVAAFEVAKERACDERDESEALHGLAITRIFGELSGATEAVDELRRREHLSPTDLARLMTAELALRHFGDHLHEPLHLDLARHALTQVEDPRARTALSYRATYLLTQKSEYSAAEQWLDLFFEDATRYALEFAIPYGRWVEGAVHIGLRRFGQAERAIQAVEDFAADRNDANHQVNARCLRARLLLEIGDPEGAMAIVLPDPSDGLIPSWRAEYIATRAMALSCGGRLDEAAEAASEATKSSRALEVRMLANAARAIVDVKRGRDCTPLLDGGRRTGVWDPVLCALRASPELADTVGRSIHWAEDLGALYSRSADRSLAKRSGLRTRSTEAPHHLLSPRELEVLELIAKGFKNRQISRALYIAESTTKVHVRHVFEKLGVRSRAEAIARYEMFANRKTGGSGSLDA